MDTTPLNVRIPASLHRRLKVLAAKTGISIQDLAAEAIRDLLRKKGG